MAKHDLVGDNQDLGVAADSPADEPDEAITADKVVPEGATFGDQAVAE